VDPELAAGEAKLIDYTGVTGRKEEGVVVKWTKRGGYYGEVEKPINYREVYSFVATKPIYFSCRLEVN